MMRGRVEGAPGDHCGCRRGSLPGRGRPQLRRLPALDQPVARPLPQRGRGRLRTPVETAPLVTECNTGRGGGADPGPADGAENKGLDAGPHTLVWHLANQDVQVSPATVSRILTRHGAVPPDPSKRPKSAGRRFQAELPNQLWQSDFTHWQLADGTDVEIL